MPRQQKLDVFLSKKGPSREANTLKKQSTKALQPKQEHVTRKPNRRTTTDESTSDSDIRRIRTVPVKQNATIDSSSDSGSDSLEIITPAKTRQTRQHRRAVDTPSGSDLSEDDSEGSPEQMLARSVKRKIVKRVADSDQDESQEEVEPKRRKLIRGKRKSPSPSEGSEDLMDEVEPSRIIQQRLRNTKKSAFSQKLDAYKRRKNGSSPLKPIEISEDQDESEESDDESVQPFEDARPDNGDDTLEPSDGEDDFIVEDDEEPVELPLEFSRHSHQDVSVHFKVICQLFVHLAVTPPEGRSQFMELSMKKPYFSLPLTTVQRKLSGLRDSLVASNAWKPEFTSALKIHPGFDISDLDFAQPVCDACKIGGRVSTLSGVVSGRRYDRVTYQPIEPNSDSSEDEDDDVRPREFYLGRFCARRARVYHSLTHWEYLLFDSLRSEVHALQHPQETLTGQAFIRVSWGGGVELPDDTDDPDQIMDWLDGRGILQAEWNKINGLMEDSHHLDSRQAAED